MQEVTVANEKYLIQGRCWGLGSSRERMRTNISHRRGGRGGDEGEVYIVMFVSIVPGSHGGVRAAENVVLSSATVIATVAHRYGVNKQSRNQADIEGRVRRRGGIGGSGRLGILEVGVVKVGEDARH